MPKTLSQTQLLQLAAQLNQRYSLLLQEVREEVRETVENSEALPSEAATLNLSIDLNRTLTERHLQEIADIEAARMRIHEGTFGICVVCGDNIGFERLCVYPTAKRCVDCQQRHERPYAHERTPTL